MGLVTAYALEPNQKAKKIFTMIREKNPAANLKLAYKRVFRICMAITLALHVTIAIAFPRFESGERAIRQIQHVISVEDIPETRQIKRPPPPPRPAVPIETESAEVPDDVTIESTDLDFDEVSFDLPPPPPNASEGEAEEEEIVEFWAVEKRPELITGGAPVYPDVAVKAEIEGVVFVQFVVGRDGKVYNAKVIKGPPIFHQPALDAISVYVFKPAIQNDQAVSVFMTQPIRFRLRDRNKS